MSAGTIRLLEGLEELTIDAHELFNDDEGRPFDNDYIWLPDFLGNLPSPSSLKRFTLGITVNDREDAEQQKPLWNRVDVILTSRKQFSCLDEVEFKIRHPEALGLFIEEELEEEIKETIDATRRIFFPTLLASKQLLESYDV